LVFALAFAQWLGAYAIVITGVVGLLHLRIALVQHCHHLRIAPVHSAWM
jgi:hypothetical protein